MVRFATLAATGFVLIAYAAPLADWSAAICIDHLPTFTRVAPDTEGRMLNHKSVGRDAMVAVCAVLADEALMKEVRTRAAECKPYPACFAKAIDGDPCGLYRWREVVVAICCYPPRPFV
ncbi:MAG: hypothetical protein QF756_02455 [Dehalococcoidia bacterium]|nr:hypothetical protein [Dehalococcoidia bacterium]HCV27760.1 hypothetical protein [Dehalococcoidia bacterium]